MASDSSRILVVDDEEGITSLLAETLRLAGFTPSVARTGIEALEATKRENHDLVLLDVNLPLMDGFETLSLMRKRNPGLPIIMISARQDRRDVIEGLKAGADDYVTKPFSIEEVVLRIQAVMRRNSIESPDEILKVGPITLSLATYEVHFQDELVELSRTEFNLLHSLMENSTRVMTKDQLLRTVWGYEFLASTNVVDTYISYLRRKLHRDGYAGIKTVRGIGFQIKES